MGDIAIRAEGLSKQYRIGKQERYRTFRDTLSGAVTAPFRRAYGLLRGNASSAANLSETIWALNDVSFEVKKGEVIGFIGRNGAGKSTLLKILARIAEPTKGRAEIYGRVGALLEVGTGFHQELTGRENIYLNAAILGMTRTEINRKFDEIVAFAEVEKFIDTPVKYYSSGMGLRLGFAVAAHLEPEILIVDEVLAVGDAAFQKKCLGKIGDIAGGGRTVLFVSHNMAAMLGICNVGILLKEGNIVARGSINDVVDQYLNVNASGRTFQNQSTRPGVYVETAKIIGGDVFPSGEPLTFEVTIVSDKKLNFSLDWTISDENNAPLITASPYAQYGRQDALEIGTNLFRITTCPLPLAEGGYKIRLDINRPFVKILETIEDCLHFSISSCILNSDGRSIKNVGRGTIVFPFEMQALNSNFH